MIKQEDFLGSYQEIGVTYHSNDYRIKHSNQQGEYMAFKVANKVILRVLSHYFVLFNLNKRSSCLSQVEVI